MELRNNRGGDVIQSPLSHAEAAQQFAELYGRDNQHWLWYWIHKSVADRPKAETQAALTFLADMFLVAIGYGLKSPKIRCHYKNRRFKFYLSNRGTVCLKTGALSFVCSCGSSGTHEEIEECDGERRIVGHDPVGREEYAGCLNEGKFLLPRFGETPRQLLSTEKDFLARFEQNPIQFLAECSRDMGRCCYCNLPLEDPTSKRVGYGKVCAARYGLPWGDKRYVEKAPSFAKCYDRDGALLLQAIRDEPTADTWAVFGDWLEEHRLPRCKQPQSNVVLPRG